MSDNSSNSSETQDNTQTNTSPSLKAKNKKRIHKLFLEWLHSPISYHNKILEALREEWGYIKTMDLLHLMLYLFTKGTKGIIMFFTLLHLLYLVEYAILGSDYRRKNMNLERAYVLLKFDQQNAKSEDKYRYKMHMNDLLAEISQQKMDLLQKTRNEKNIFYKNWTLLDMSDKTMANSWILRRKIGKPFVKTVFYSLLGPIFLNLVLTAVTGFYYLDKIVSRDSHEHILEILNKVNSHLASDWSQQLMRKGRYHFDPSS